MATAPVSSDAWTGSSLYGSESTPSWRSVLSPQQCTVASPRSTQVCPKPPEMAVTSESQGTGVAPPPGIQDSTLPDVVTAHAPRPVHASICTIPLSSPVTAPGASNPCQQVTPPDVEMPQALPFPKAVTAVMPLVYTTRSRNTGSQIPKS